MCNTFFNFFSRANCAKSLVTRDGGWSGVKRFVVPEVGVTVAGMDKTMNQETREQVMAKLRRRYAHAGLEHKKKLLNQAQEVLGYHRKSAIRALRAEAVPQGPLIITGRPVTYEPGLRRPFLRPIWQAADYACGRRLVAMLPEWLPAYEAHERKVPGEVREKLLAASGRTLDRLGEMRYLNICKDEDPPPLATIIGTISGQEAKIENEPNLVRPAPAGHGPSQDKILVMRGDD